MLYNFLRMRLILLLKNVNKSLGLFFLIVGFLVFLYLFKAENTIWYSVVSTLVLTILHLGRKDLGFAKNVLGRRFYTAISLEYLVLWLFISCFFIFKDSGFTYLLSGTLCFILPFVKIKPYFLNLKFISFFPPFLFEWKSYMRRNFAGLLCYWIFFVCCSFHPATLMFSLMFWTGILLKIYTPQESKDLLIAGFSKYNLQKKINYSFLFCFILCLPVMVSFLILNFSQKEYVFYFLIYIFVINYLLIIQKYALFEEKTKEGAISEAVQFKLLLLILGIIPALLYIYQNKKIAEKKINLYV